MVLKITLVQQEGVIHKDFFSRQFRDVVYRTQESNQLEERDMIEFIFLNMQNVLDEIVRFMEKSFRFYQTKWRPFWA
ncbi:hypothetical protein LEP1GSC016_1635 [Leptospira borgpetersenii serovar Hardjo-bovis str. Sponselee]|uniref:Uncharacterized protein n=2 Tax=Leptospira borgpetersenii TaxID=174 RepID=M6BGD9_LEPBO|nr:hypothetical protein LBK6_11850 [Leptospira borgpetersenii serovar Hardjo]AWV70779.1 hypothetical protein B9T54_12775 [Leptospira borgpetersenii serovar Hardjo-bovis]EMJ77636.1 hypothetical protein LEP1GSC016_1635 [Leptospira borgpetersenii serovar Hardjo-bovis str. Sponselee]EMN13350.1 hypothetical protein LEP1GSC055_1163 [Leptospira borgpetersenii str. Brem 307]EMN17366.1 hypothetical protein LEP1GSC056_3847 [Leptospira borgpetersenii str. Brem 328]TQE51915.1 hypothetical protein FFZ95_12